MKITTSAFDHMTLLSQLLLAPEGSYEASGGITTKEEFDRLVALAASHHVLVRALERFCQPSQTQETSPMREWATNALAKERARIANALQFLNTICRTMDAAGCPVVVMKSLDHWPDLGSDLDLFTMAKAADVVRVMSDKFAAQIAARSWGDRLANKWNFIVPGLPEAVEVHIGRLGQTGEQLAVARGLTSRSALSPISGYEFRLPASEDRIMISTMQRMYRHFYLRLCDVIDMAGLLESGRVDYRRLQSVAEQAGLWEGVAAYLVVVSDYVAQFRGHGVELPQAVIQVARFGGGELHFRRGFLRIPIRPHAVGFYTSELRTLARNRELRNMLRLSLLPCLATAAVIEQRITGSDKGIW